MAASIRPVIADFSASANETPGTLELHSFETRDYPRTRGMLDQPRAGDKANVEMGVVRPCSVIACGRRRLTSRAQRNEEDLTSSDHANVHEGRHAVSASDCNRAFRTHCLAATPTKRRMRHVRILRTQHPSKSATHNAHQQRSHFTNGISPNRSQMHLTS